ncbi:sigma-70 family RNA polymerase sigma factor [Pseudoalteromonas fuliginea]|uniref:Sigma-70 family RNA polymerase sigma factor n=1 Tax=Pseudoalteromonas fuliginea TaxID=1872678 RepID=A0AB73BEQ2_9GAMM|nr:sigma-70 family RNA polymerase sigma factor [Pseudoalteromonas fuliginea]KAA1158624.1 sigma-70 family RNA polymerase sigma factor [Pseudoalteromonas fuliginea]
MLLSIKSWLFETPSKDCMASYAKSGDNRYLEQLIALYSNDLYHYLVTQSNTHLAYDVSQQTWLKVIEKRHLYQAQTTPKAWLFKLARNTLIDEYRRQQHFVELDENTHLAAQNDESESDLNSGDLNSGDLTSGDSHIGSSNISYEAFDAALKQLSFVQREAITLQQEGFSLTDIELITQSSLETIKTRLRYAKQNLKRLLGANNEQA